MEKPRKRKKATIRKNITAPNKMSATKYIYMKMHNQSYGLKCNQFKIDWPLEMQKKTEIDAYM